MKSVWRISEKRGAREGCANYESNRWRGNGEEVGRGRGFIMQSRWLRLQLCFLSSRHRPRENSLVDFAALDTALTTLPTEDTFDEPSRKLIMQGGRDRYPSPGWKDRLRVADNRFLSVQFEFSSTDSSTCLEIRKMEISVEGERLFSFGEILAILWERFVDVSAIEESFRYTNFSTVKTRKSSKDREQWTRQSFSTCNGWLARACTT